MKESCTFAVINLNIEQPEFIQEEQCPLADIEQLENEPCTSAVFDIIQQIISKISKKVSVG